MYNQPNQPQPFPMTQPGYPGYPQQEMTGFQPGYPQQQTPGFQPGYPVIGHGMPQQPVPGMQVGYADRYLAMVQPVVEYGLHEMRYTNARHAMTEIALVSYFMGQGYDFVSARRLVESWEINEQFPLYRD